MTSPLLKPSRGALLLGACLLAGCPADGGETKTTTDTTSEPVTTGDTTVPTTGTASNPSEPTTTEATTGITTTGDDTSTGDGSSSTGEPALACTDLDNEDACKAEPECKWGGVVGFDYGAKGCQGSISQFCIAKKPAGSASAWYREVNGETQVVEFAYTPTDLDAAWTPCDCDGPLACLCTSVTADCPDRQDQFCGVNITPDGCKNASIKGTGVCGWFAVKAAGPKDDTCTADVKHDRCIPAFETDKVGCKDELAPLPPYPDVNDQPMCTGDKTPVYWRDKDNLLELTEACGPKPLGWTRCESEDTLEQPDECKCLCTF